MIEPRPTRKPRRLGLLLTALVLLALVGGLAWQFRERSLLDKATRVADATGWYQEQLDANDRLRMDSNNARVYQWISNREVLYFRDVSMHRIDVFVSPAGGGTLCHYDTTTGKTTILTEMTRRFNTTYGKPNLVNVSPDGKSLLWSATVSETIYSAALNGTRFSTSSIEAPYRSVNYVWLPDSQHWMLFKWDYGNQQNNNYYLTRSYVRNIGMPQASQIIPLTTSVRAFSLDANYVGIELVNSTLFVDNRDVLGYAPIPQPANLPPPYLEIQELSLSPKVDVTKTVKIVLSRDMGGRRTFAYAPDSKRLAWIITAHSVPTFPRLIHKFWKGFPAKPVDVAGIWVSQLDGTEMREIGHVALDLKNPAEMPSTLQWTPDGKRISFLCRNALWTVEAD